MWAAFAHHSTRWAGLGKVGGGVPTHQVLSFFLSRIYKTLRVENRYHQGFCKYCAGIGFRLGHLALLSVCPSTSQSAGISSTPARWGLAWNDEKRAEICLRHHGRQKGKAPKPHRGF